MPTLKKIVAGLTVAAQLVLNFGLGGVALARSPAAPRGAAEKTALAPRAAAAKPRQTLPAPDWLRVDWNQEVVLPSDEAAYQAELKKLLASGNTAAARVLTPVKRRLTDEAVVRQLNLPEAARERIRAYREAVQNLPADAAAEQSAAIAALQTDLREIIPAPAATTSTEEPLDHVLDTSAAQTTAGLKLVPYDPASQPKPTITIKIAPTDNSFPANQFNGSLEDIIEQSEHFGPETFRLSKPVSSASAGWWQKVMAWLAPLPAHAATPIISYTQGIESKPFDYALYYISQTQNPDGSFGTLTPYESTAETIFMLNRISRAANDQYAAALNYALATTTDNNRALAKKIRLLAGENKPTAALLTELVKSVNADGGYGLRPGHESDILTTSEAALAFILDQVNLKDRLDEALSFIYNQIPNNGELIFSPDGYPSLYLVNAIAQNLLPFIDKTFTDKNGKNYTMQDKINPLLGFLRRQYDPAEKRMLGASDVMDEIMTARTWRLYDAEPAAYAELRARILAQQSSDGSFKGAVFPTAYAILALGQADLVITNFAAIVNLVNRSPAAFTITVKNQGYYMAGTSTLHIFADGYNFDDVVKGMTLPPGGFLFLILNLPETASFIGAVDLRVYLEPEAVDLNYDDNWKSQAFTFAPNAQNKPALPFYYIAQKYDIDNAPALNVRWLKKADPDRQQYVVMWREKGQEIWNYFGIDNSWNGAFLSPYAEGALYEVTAGVMARDQDKTITYFTQPTDVKTSANPALYQGGATGGATDSRAALPAAVVSGYGITATTDANGNFVAPNLYNGSSAAYVNVLQYDALTTKFFVPISATTTDIRMHSRLKEDGQPPTVTDFSIRFKPNFTVVSQQEVELLAFVSDNVGTKEVDYYAWLPADGVWRYLGTQAVNNNSDALFKWYVPADFLGPNYKVKAIARDFRGNESAPKEWGPFTVIDGTPPRFTITSPTSSSTWQIGATERITWNTSSTYGVTRVTLKLHYPRTTEYIASGIPNTGSYDWSIRTSTAFAGAALKLEVSGQDQKNYLVGSGAAEGLTIADATPLPAPPWGGPGLLPNALEKSDMSVDKNATVLGTDRQGVTHLVYRYLRDSVVTNPRVIIQEFWRRAKSGGVWSAPELIYSETTETDNNLTGYRPIGELRLAFDRADHPQIVWTRSTVGGCEEIDGKEIEYLTFDGLTWQGPVNLSNNATESFAPDVVVDSAGDTHVAWLDGRTWDNICKVAGQMSLRHRRASLGQWGAENTLQPDPSVYNPRLAATGDGRVHLVYAAGGTSRGHLVYDQNVWSQPKVFWSGGYTDGASLTSASGTLALAFREQVQDPETKQYYWRINVQRYAGGAWGAASEAAWSQIGRSVENPMVVLDRVGTAHLTFEEQTPNGVRSYRWTTKMPNGQWQSPQSVTRVSHTVYSGSGALTYNPASHRLSAVWIADYAMQSEIMESEADLTNNVSPAAFLYEDAEDGTTKRWRINNPNGPVGAIANILDPDHGRVIEIKVADVNNQNYWLYDADGQTQWQNTRAKNLQFDFKTQTEAQFYARVETNLGTYYLMYSFDYPKTGLVFGNYVSIHLDPALKDGAWHTINRDLEADLKSVNPNLTLTRVDNFIAGSQSVRVDNVWLIRDPAVRQVTGTITDNNGPVSGVTVKLEPGGRTATTDPSGAYRFSSVSPGTYTVIPESPEFTFTPASATVIIVHDNRVANFTVAPKSGRIYEDAEDGTTKRWQFNNPGGGAGTITNVADDAEHSRVIEIKVADVNNQNYWLYDADGQTQWQNTRAKNLQFDFKTQTEAQFYARVETNLGTYYLMYSFDYPKTGLVFGNYVSIHLDPALKDGAWHTINRDLEADLKSVNPNLTLTRVDNFIAGSQSMRVDNVQLIKNPTVFSIAGRITDANQQPLAGVMVRATPGFQTVTTDANGTFLLASLSNGNYTVTPEHHDYSFTPTSTIVAINNAPAIADFVGVLNTIFVYEDAEDGTTKRWKINNPNGPAGTIENVADDPEHSRVIEIKVADVNNQNYWLYDADGQTQWQNTRAKNLQFDFKTQTEAQFYARVETNLGTYYLMYSFDYPKTGLVFGNYVSIHLDPALKDGAWHTINRDLVADLAQVEPGATITQVDTFIVGSSDVRVDNIKLVQ